MFICDIKFNINWFTTLPGMLISGGVLLLLIALILFVKSGKGGKAAKENVVSTDVAPNFNSADMNAGLVIDQNVNNNIGSNQVEMPAAEPIAVEPVQPEVTPVEVTPVTPEMPIAEPIAVEPVQPEVTPVEVAPVTPEMPIAEPIAVEPVQPEVTPVAPEMPAAEPIAVEPVQPEATPVEVAPVTPEMPAAEPIAVEPVQPEVTPVEVAPVTPEMPVVEPAVYPESVTADVDLEKTQTIPVVNDTNNAYGGVSPKVELNDTERHEIYGGANPLDKTQTIPTINEQVQNNNIPEINNEDTNKLPPQNQSVEPTVNPVYPEAKIVEDKGVEVLDL